MVRIAINGVCGRMGNAVEKLLSERSDCACVFGIDSAFEGKNVFPFPVFKSADEVPDSLSCDVIVDFSHFSAVPQIVSFAVKRNCGIVVCTTGLTPETQNDINAAARTIPVFVSANMSIGVCLLRKLVKEAALFLGEGFDIEIVEKHHRNKLDAPSGTALAIADSINDALDEKFEYVYGRHDRLAKRPANEIGISSVRGGSIVGDHEVIFAGRNEVIEIKHSAQSREVFADGAVRAALFISGKQPGKYSMEDLIK